MIDAWVANSDRTEWVPLSRVVKFRVAEHHEGMERLILNAGPERHAHCHRQAMPERARAHLHPRDLDVRMHSERRLERVEKVEDGVVDEARLREHRP